MDGLHAFRFQTCYYSPYACPMRLMSMAQDKLRVGWVNLLLSYYCFRLRTWVHAVLGNEYS